jgi:F-type H+-transporting ATPase subunit a
MPQHASWLTLLLAYMKDTLAHNASTIGDTIIGHHPSTWESFEPITASLIVAGVVLLVALSVRSRLSNVKDAVVPDDKLTLRTFMEAFLGYFYDLAKSVMDAERAKKYFPLIGTAATFVFFANVMALIPGLPVATTSLNITLGSALVVFILFNAYGIATNGLGYFKHLAGPMLILAPLIFLIEVISLCVRPITLAVRLMLNMAVDHLIIAIFLALVGVAVPLPAMLLGVIVVIVQTLVFTLLTSIYIGLATEPAEHH